MNPKLKSYNQTEHSSTLPPLTKELLFAHFKECYLKSLSKKEESPFEEILAQTCYEQDVAELNQEIKDDFFHWYMNIHHLDFLSSYIENPHLRELIIHNSFEGQIETEKRLENLNFTLLPHDYQLALEVLALRHHIAWNFSKPFASFPIELKGEQYRATLIHEGISPKNKSKLFLRRLSKETFSLEKFKIDDETGQFLNKAIQEKKNILVAGATGSGKTSFMRTLLKAISANEHLVIIEDTHELIEAHPHASFLLGENLPHKTLKDHCAYALRMRPDRIIIGEMRSEEVVPFVLAMNTGHKGLMSTVHANSASDSLHRLALLFTLYSQNENLSYELIMKLICQNIDYVVFLKERKIDQIIKVLGSEGNQPYFNFIFGNEDTE